MSLSIDLPSIDNIVLGLAGAIDREVAVGLTGSLARGIDDPLSDVDICIYVNGSIPGSPW